MKKILALFLSLVLVISFSFGTCIPVFAGDSPAIVVSSAKTTKGNTVAITISLVNNPGIGSLKIKVAFPDDLILNKPVTYDIIRAGGQATQPGKVESPVTLNWVSPFEDVEGDLVFATLSFTVSETAELGDKDITVTYNQDDIYNLAEDDVPFAVENGKIIVVNCMHETAELSDYLPATCAAAGYSGDTYCTICGEKMATGLTIDALGHDYAAAVTDPTCTSDGYTIYTCTRCADSYKGDTTDALGHNWSDWTVTTAATCTKPGVLTRVCGRDASHTETTALDALGHDYSAVVIPPTCTARGYTTYTCARCTDTFVADYVDPLGHTAGEWIIDKRATLTETGLKHRVCTACGETVDTEEIPVINPDDPRIELASKKVRAGKIVDVKIALINNPGIASMKLNVAFGDELTLKSVAYNTEIGGSAMLPQTMNSPVVLNWYDGEGNVNGDFIYATLTFEVAADAEIGYKDIEVSYNQEDVYNIGMEDIEFALMDYAVEVISYIPGDINDDGLVNNKDLTRLFQYLSDCNVEVNHDALDVNGDGAVNNKDLTRLFQYLSDWNVEIY